MSPLMPDFVRPGMPSGAAVLIGSFVLGAALLVASIATPSGPMAAVWARLGIAVVLGGNVYGGRLWLGRRRRAPRIDPIDVEPVEFDS